jgi:hypothetical protein
MFVDEGGCKRAVLRRQVCKVDRLLKDGGIHGAVGILALLHEGQEVAARVVRLPGAQRRRQARLHVWLDRGL